jgi:predicted transcriptional regulator
MDNEKLQNAKSVRTTVSLPSDDYVELEALARKHRVSVAWIIRDAVQKYLDGQAPLLRAHSNTIDRIDAHS